MRTEFDAVLTAFTAVVNYVYLANDDGMLMRVKRHPPVTHEKTPAEDLITIFKSINNNSIGCSNQWKTAVKSL